MFWNKKDKAPFERGNLVSNGKNRKIVNSVFKNKDGVWSMLVDNDDWDDKTYESRWCEEVICSDYYLVKK